MSDTVPPRPTFTDGQYIGAADLNAAVAYARDETQRLALSGQAWGIATGLALVEVTDTTGSVQMFIEPGIAWDGYGRPVVVLTPAPVTPDLFTGLGAGLQPVWLRYMVTATQAVTPGFLTCGTGDPATRVQESYLVVAGAQTATSAGVVINGVTVPDPRDMLTAVDQNAAVVLDSSVPQQSFPDDTAIWLIPVGMAYYNGDAAASFAIRTPGQLLSSRLARRYIGAIAESVLAADGVLRLRDRQTDNPSGATDANLDSDAAIKTGDLGIDPNNATRLVGNELVWVEGNLRVTGHARLFGTQLELRDPNGTTGGGALDVPQFLRRAVNPPNNPLHGQDLQVCFDRPGDTTGINRLTFGVAPAASPNPPSSATLDGLLTELMVVRADGRVAIGTNTIDGYSSDANTLVVAAPGNASNTGITVVGGPNNTGNLYFADGTGSSTTTTTPPQKDGFVSYDHKAQVMTLGANAGTVLSLTGTGQAVIGPANPGTFAADADQLIVSDINDGPAGITIVGGNKGTATIDFTDDTSAANAGFVRYHAETNHMAIGTASTTRVFIDQNGQVGIGTTTPTAPLTVASATNSLQVTPLSLQALSGASAGPLTLQLAGGNTGVGTLTPEATLHVRGLPGTPTTALMLDSPIAPNVPVIQFAMNGGVQSTLYLDPNTGSTHVINAAQPALTIAGSSVGVGVIDPPRTTLDVRGVPPAGVTEASHVAVVENLSPLFDSNVLALRSAAGNVGGSNFITFLDGNDNQIGAVEGYNLGGLFNSVMFNAYLAADYAEAVLRDAKTPPIAAGSVVGVRAGVVSLVTEGADCLFVTTDRPAVLGNAPPKSQRAGYEMLAFIGQVAVLVGEAVQPGDLIVASGRADGLGRAVAADTIEAEDLGRVVGQAWAAVTPEPGKPQRVNALVGPGVASAAASGALLRRQAAEMVRQNEATARQATEAQRQAGAIEALAEANRHMAEALRQQEAAIAAQAAELKQQSAEIKRLAAQLARRKAPAAR
jgi:hypothetical protein